MIRSSWRSGRWLTAIGAIALGLAAPGTLAAVEQDDPAKEQSMSFWMKKKLDYSQNILAGISTGDFEKIVQNAQSMQSLSKVEGFVRGRTPGYRTQLHIFEEANAEIIRQANRDNLEGAALAFTQMTVSCVNCHKNVREGK